MLAIVPSFVLFYLGYVSYVSFHCRLVFQFEPAYGIRHDFAWNIVQLNAVYIVVKNSCRVRLTLLTILRMWLPGFCVPHSILLIYTILYSYKLTWRLPLLMRAQHLSGKSISIKWTSDITRGTSAASTNAFALPKSCEVLGLSSRPRFDIIRYSAVQPAGGRCRDQLCSCRIFWWRSNCG